jgi:hypothetical protein
VNFFVQNAPVEAIITGGLDRTGYISSTFELDASASRDGNTNSNETLSYEWSCVVDSGDNYLQSCDNVMAGKTSFKVLADGSGLAPGTK